VEPAYPPGSPDPVFDNEVATFDSDLDSVAVDNADTV
jgi:hypothetical protein